MIGRFLNRAGIRGVQDAFERMRLILASFRRIPYENLSKIVGVSDDGRDPGQEAETLFRGYFKEGSGGTCFSLVNALAESLAASGIDSRVHLADRKYGPNTHCALVARADGREWLLDPGFLVFEPVPFPQGSVPAPGGRIEWRESGGRIEASTLFASGGSKSRYSLRTAPAGRDEFLDAWRRSFSFEMMHYPVVTGILPDGRHLYLRGGHVTIGGKYEGKLEVEGISDCASRLGIGRDLVTRALAVLGAR